VWLGRDGDSHRAARIGKTQCKTLWSWSDFTPERSPGIVRSNQSPFFPQNLLRSERSSPPSTAPLRFFRSVPASERFWCRVRFSLAGRSSLPLLWRGRHSLLVFCSLFSRIASWDGVLSGISISPPDRPRRQPTLPNRPVNQSLIPLHSSLEARSAQLLCVGCYRRSIALLTAARLHPHGAS
jgi:hypothetical protein